MEASGPPPLPFQPPCPVSGQSQAGGGDGATERPEEDPTPQGHQPLAFPGHRTLSSETMAVFLRASELLPQIKFLFPQTGVREPSQATDLKLPPLLKGAWVS